MKPLASYVFFGALSVASLLVSCKPDMVVESLQKVPEPPVVSHKNPEDTLTVFLTGNTLGTLKPCGCSTGQLGGFDRRDAILNKVPEDKKLIIDTGKLLAGNSQQDSIKMTMIFQALALLDYDAVNLSRNDLTIARDIGLLEDNLFKVVTASDATIPAIFARDVQVAGRKMRVNAVTIDAESLDIDNLKNIFPDATEQLRLNILIAENFNCSSDSDILTAIEAMNIVDVIVCSPEADEPEVLSTDKNGLLVITVGRLGKYLGELTVGISKDDSVNLSYTSIAVDETLPVTAELVELYGNYQQMLRDYNLLEELPKIPLGEGLSYAGSDACKLCHGYEYDKWSIKKHAHAYQTLVEVGSQYDPECVECHVVGLKYESGFVNEVSEKGLMNVGCEICHGPSSKHIESILSGNDVVELGSPKFGCNDCHTPEHSPGYGADKDGYFKKIIHWMEPEANKNVE